MKKESRSDRTIMFIAHCDEVGMMVKYIDELGFLYFALIGDVDLSVLRGSMVTITHNDKLINGVIGTKPIHFAKKIIHSMIYTLKNYSLI